MGCYPSSSSSLSVTPLMHQKEKVLKRKIDPERPPAMAWEKKSHSQDNHQGIRNWSNLPHDILRMIMRTLRFSERLCMTATCKGWRIPVYGVNNPLNLDGLPWLFSHPLHIRSDNLYQFKIYEPGNPKPYTIGKDIIKKGGNKLILTRVCASKFGWVVFHHYVSATWSFFLYSPFAENMLQLPDLFEMQMGPMLFTFSNVPTSRDCIFFLLHQKSMKEVHLYTYHNGEREWKRYICDISLCGCDDHGLLSDSKFSKNIVYLDGILYCLFTCMNKHTLATFNLSEQKWNLKTTSVISTESTGARLMLLESDKGLLALCKSFTNHFKFRIFKYDCSQDELITRISLEDHILFLDVCSAFSIDALGEAKGKISNRIYYKFCDFKSSLSYFSIKDDEIHEDSIIYMRVCQDTPWDCNILFLDVSRLGK